MKWGLKGGISIDADSGPPRYVLWCCGGICHQLLTFFKIGCGHTVPFLLWTFISLFYLDVFLIRFHYFFISFSFLFQFFFNSIAVTHLGFFQVFDSRKAFKLSPYKISTLRSYVQWQSREGLIWPSEEVRERNTIRPN